MEGLKGLEEQIQGFSVESLRNNEAFVTTVMHATQVAIRTHHREKIEALKNAVLNAASGNSPDEDLQLIFLNLLERMTSWHLRLLLFFQDPEAYAEAKGKQQEYDECHSRIMAHISSDKVLEDQQRAAHDLVAHVFPDLRDNRLFYTQVIKDLFDYGLISEDPLHLIRLVTYNRTTKMGDHLLVFISSPFASVMV